MAEQGMVEEPYRCCGCGKPFIENAYKDCDCPTNCGFRGGTNDPVIVSKPRCAWCQSYPTRANIDGEDLCQACCEKWVRGEGIDAALATPEVSGDE